eukprot:m.61996 g.61996  ORF g.61996 m.61996 type:complete len:176 (-) comp11891_c1_seq1:24-551(-)
MADKVLSVVETDHSGLLVALGARHTNIRAANASNGFSGVVSHLVAIEDLSALVDLTPYICKSLALPEAEQQVEVSQLVELFPLLQQLLESPYEDYIVAALMISSEIVQRWKPELLAMTKESKSAQLQRTVSMQDTYHALQNVYHIAEKLSRRADGRCTKQAKELVLHLSDIFPNV